MKKRVSIIVFACAFALTLGLAGCSGGSDSSATSSGEPEATPATTTTEAPTTAAVDVSHIDYDVAAMSNEEAFAFMEDFMNRTPADHEAEYGKVLRIEGQVGRYAKMENGEETMVSYSVGVKGEGGVIWGTEFYVEGWGPDDYPSNKTHVQVTGVYGYVEGYGASAGRTLICNPEDVIVLE